MTQSGNDRSPWIDSLIANGPLPILLLLLIPLGSFFEHQIDPYIFRIMMLIGINIILAVSLQLINGFSGQFSLGHAGFMAVGAYLAAYPAINYSQRLHDPIGPLWFYIALAALTVVVAAILGGLFFLLRVSQKLFAAAPAVLMLLLLVWLMIDVSIASSPSDDEYGNVLIWSKLFSLISNAFSGALDHGQPIAAKIAASIPLSIAIPACFLVLILGSASFAAVVGFIVGLPALRLRGDYLAIATLGMAEIIRIVIQNSPPLGGALGLTGIPRYTNFSWLYAFAVITIVVVWRLAYSSQGRAIVAVREDEIAASACGVDPTGRKVTAFVIGAFFAGVAGALFALLERNITPGYFNMTKSIEVVVMVTLGGLGSISGAILAAAVLTILPELLREPPSIGWGWVGVLLLCGVIVAIARRRGKPWKTPVLTILIACAAWEIIRALAIVFNIRLSELRMVIYSSSLVLMMLLRPQGLLGGRELWPRRLFGRRAAIATEDRQSPATVAIS